MDRPSLKEQLAYVLRHHRTKQGLTQAQLATRAGLTQSVIARLEAGRANPSLRQIERVAGTLGIVFLVSAHTPVVSIEQTSEDPYP